MVDVDLVAPYIVSKAVLPGMIERGHGKIINVCSILSELGRETVAAYTAAKGGLKLLTQNICAEFGGKNIQCNGHWPGLHCHAADRTPAGAAERRQPSSL